MAAIAGAEYYRVGRRKFAAYPVTKKDISKLLLEIGYEIELIKTVKAKVANKRNSNYTGYQGLIFIKARKIYAGK